MPIKVFHPDHGYVLTCDQAEVDMLVAKGGQIVLKGKVKNEETEETTTPKVLDLGGIDVPVATLPHIQRYGKRK